MEYFKEYPFFKDYEKENGREALEMLYKVIAYEFHPKGENVIKYGDFGTTFYILVNGAVGVRIPSLVEKTFTFYEMVGFLLDNKSWIIKNDKYQHLLSIVQDFLPEVIKTNYQGEMTLNSALIEQVLNQEIILESQRKYKDFFPTFKSLKKYKHCEDDTMQIKLNMMTQVGVFKPGKSFGELALLNNSKRSATVVALKDSEFAVLDKENFDIVMAKLLRK